MDSTNNANDKHSIDFKKARTFVIVLLALIAVLFIVNIIVVVSFNKTFTKEGTLSYIDGTGTTIETRFKLPIGYELCENEEGTLGEFILKEVELKQLGIAAYDKDGDRIVDAPLGAVVDWEPEETEHTSLTPSLLIMKLYGQSTAISGVHPGAEMDGGVILAVAKHKTDETKPVVVLIGKMSGSNESEMYVANNKKYVLDEDGEIDEKLRNYYGAYWCPLGIEETK